MKILKYKVADRLYQSETGPEAQVGDQVKLFLDTEANPELPEFVFGIIQPGIRRVDCDEYTIYTIEYELAEFTLRQDDILYSEVVTSVDLVTADLVAEVAARIADVNAEESARIAADALKAPITNAVLVNPSANTPTLTDNDTSLATTAFVQGQSTVRYSVQSLTSPQQLQARTNIGVVNVDFNSFALFDADGAESLDWDNRQFKDAGGTAVLSWSSSGLVLVDGKNILTDTVTGSQVATLPSQKLSFHGVTPVAQRAGVAQLAVPTTVLTVSNPPTQAEVQAIIDRLALVTTLDNEIRAALVQKGLIKGSV